MHRLYDQWLVIASSYSGSDRARLYAQPEAWIGQNRRRQTTRGSIIPIKQILIQRLPHFRPAAHDGPPWPDACRVRPGRHRQGS